MVKKFKRWKQGIKMFVVSLLVTAALTAPMALTAYTGDESWLLLYGLLVLALPIPW